MLAQQVVACVAMDRWDVPDALRPGPQAPIRYRDLPAAAFESVLCRWSRAGSRPGPSATCGPASAGTGSTTGSHRLPGTARLALVGGGTIPDTGQYPVYLGEAGPRLGELDEEFVLERRVGETFVLGTATWRIEAIEPHRVVVSPRRRGRRR